VTTPVPDWLQAFHHPRYLREALVTTPPDFGGREIEEGVMEDLGVPPGEHPVSGDDEETVRDDNELHAAGEVCARCGAEITPGQDVRRRLDGQWIHEICP
jgi:hypothetical protein